MMGESSPAAAAARGATAVGGVLCMTAAGVATGLPSAVWSTDCSVRCMGLLAGEMALRSVSASALVSTRAGAPTVAADSACALPQLPCRHTR